MEIWHLQQVEDDLVILTALQIVVILLALVSLQVAEKVAQVKQHLLVEQVLLPQIQVQQELQEQEAM